MCSYLHQFIQHHGIEAGQVLDVVSLHHRAVLPDVSSELLHVEDQLCYVSAQQHNTWSDPEVKQHKPAESVDVYVCILVDEVVCAFLLDVVCVSKQPDDLVTGKWQRHEHE